MRSTKQTALLFAFLFLVFGTADADTWKVVSRETNKVIRGATINFSVEEVAKRVVTEENGYATGFKLPFRKGEVVKVFVEAPGYISSEKTCIMPDCEQGKVRLSPRFAYLTLEENIVGNWGSRRFIVYNTGGSYIDHGSLSVKSSGRVKPSKWRLEFISDRTGQHTICDQDCDVRVDSSGMRVDCRNPRIIKGDTGYNPDTSKGQYHAKSQTIVSVGVDSAGVLSGDFFEKGKNFQADFSTGRLRDRIVGTWSIGIYYQEDFYTGELIVEPDNSAMLLLRYYKNGKRYLIDQSVKVNLAGSRLKVRGIEATLYEEKGDILSGKSTKTFSFTCEQSTASVISGHLDGTSGKNGVLKMQRLIKR